MNGKQARRMRSLMRQVSQAGDGLAKKHARRAVKDMAHERKSDGTVLYEVGIVEKDDRKYVVWNKARKRIKDKG